MSLQPTFYPTEAESHGATPSQYGFVFGCSSLAAFAFGPVFGTYGVRIGPKLLYNLGGLTQGIVGVLFGSLDYVQNTAGLFSLLQSWNGKESMSCLLLHWVMLSIVWIFKE